MHRLKLLSLACFLIASFLPALGQLGKVDPQTARLCTEVKDVPFPAQDRPGADESRSLAGCVSQDLYYGFGKTPDPVQARKCAYLEMDAGKTGAFSGKSILMMVYANALGVPRNLDLALRLGCEIGGPDTAGRVHELHLYRTSKWQGNNFSICDHSSGPPLYGECAILDDRFDRVERHRKLDALAAQWTPRQKKAYQSFLKTAYAFFEARAGNEINLQNTFAVQELAFHERELMTNLEQFESGKLPEFTAAERRKAGEEMQEKFARTQAKETHLSGTVTAEAIRKTQPLWLAYREALVALGKERWPKVKAEDWKAWADEERVIMLDRSLR